MKRVNSFLSSGENIIKEIKQDFIKMFLSSKYTIGGIILSIATIVACITVNLPPMLLFIPILVILIGSVPALWSYTFTRYYITNAKVIIETGFIGKDYDIVKLDRVLDVNLDVTVLDTIFGTGCIKLCTANDGEPILLSNIRNPKSVIRTIQF